MRIRVIDLETTGDAPPDHGVCEIGFCDVYELQADLTGPREWIVDKPQSRLVHPGRTIPPEMSAIHHIIDEDVTGLRWWKTVLPEILQPEQNLLPPITAFAAHAVKFERRFVDDDMTGGLPWLCSYKSSLRLWPDEPSHSNQSLLYSRRPIGWDRSFSSPAHRAGPDAYVTALHIRDLLELAPIEDLIKWSGEPALQVICHIGKQRGRKWSEVDTGFLNWLLDKEFDEDVMFTARHHLELRSRARAAS